MRPFIERTPGMSAGFFSTETIIKHERTPNEKIYLDGPCTWDNPLGQYEMPAWAFCYLLAHENNQ